VNVHFIGIGGIGVSALARYHLARGARVSGSDLVASDLTEELAREGISLSISHDPRNLPPVLDLVIYSAAVRKENLELAEAKRRGVAMRSYAEALGELTREYTTIAISGSHGKSTTTSLVALAMVKAGLDPTVIVGTKLREFGGSNFRLGKSPYLVLEADEWNRSFHEYSPKVVVVTNIDREHLDTYQTFRGVAAGFSKYLTKNLADGGVAILNFKDAELRKIGARLVKQGRVKVIPYNRGASPAHSLGIPGAMNQANAEGAWQAVRTLGVKKAVAERAFREYRGAWRRLEELPARSRDFPIRARVYSDYAHHPTEIQATISALRDQYPGFRTVIVFQPHQEERLKLLFREFSRAFRGASRVVLLPVYRVSGRETLGKSVDAFTLAQAVGERQRNVSYAPDFERGLREIVSDLGDAHTIVAFMGAGDIDATLRKTLLI
jgi:UDP-N-acetylmuramate--alanine ligase